MKDNEQKIDQILNSLDGIERGSPGLYFYTRLQARLQPLKATAWDYISSYISRPVIAFGALIFVIVLNMAVLLNKTGKAERFDDNGDAYSMNSSSLFDYTNTETE